MVAHMSAKTFADLDPSAFVHPDDGAALNALRSVPGLDTLVKALMHGSIEDQWLLQQHQTAIKLGPGQYPSLYRMVEKATQVLDTPMPEVFLDTSYSVNAFAFGFKRYTVTLQSGIVDLLDDEQILTVVAHEIGHIACDHMTYKTVSELLRFVGDQIISQYLGSIGSVASVSMRLALLRWSRAAELSCDRAALLVIQDPEQVATTLCSLAGRSRRFASEFSLAAVLEQANAIEESAGLVGGMLEKARQLQLTHPDPVTRAQAILDWSRSEAYRDILEGRYPKRSEQTASEGPGAKPALDWKLDDR